VASSFLIRRFAVSLIAGLGVATLTISLAPAASAEPTVAEVTAQIGVLSKQNEQLTELYNKASEDVKAKQTQAAAAKLTALKAQTDYGVAQNQLRSTLAEQFKAAGFSRTGALLTSKSQQDYLDQLSTLQLLSARRAALSNKMKVAKETAASAQAASDKLLADATAKQKALADQRTALAADQDKYSKLLNKLTADQRATYFATANPSATPVATQEAVASLTVAAPSAAAAVAVQYALAQRGKPYVYAASGPNAFDCSGLTAAAWQAAGLRIPHVAASQYNVGTHVSRDQLQPGDLVFFYHPIGHVGMYIGNGLIVHAPTSGDVVKVVPLSTFNSDYVGATRL
jgi:cell wall-associated NlpC family hydrolase